MPIFPESRSTHSKPLTGDLTAVAVLLSKWKADADRLEVLDPKSSALPVRRVQLEELEAALVRAQNAPAWLTIAQAHETQGVPTSTLRYYCKTVAAEIGAEKHRGMWRIDARGLESFLARPHIRTQAKAA